VLGSNLVRDTGYHDWGFFLCFPSVLSVKYEDNTSVKPRPLPYESFQFIIHLSSYHLTLYSVGRDSQINNNDLCPCCSQGTHRRVFSPVKSRLNRIPVITYRKVVDKGRSSWNNSRYFFFVSLASNPNRHIKISNPNPLLVFYHVLHITKQLKKGAFIVLLKCVKSWILIPCLSFCDVWICVKKCCKFITN
jgi:hypothetical protein